MRKQLGQMLIEAGAIDETSLRAALADQRRWGRPLGRTLVELRLINEEEMIRVLGQQLGMPSVDLDKVAIPKTVLSLVPANLATQHGIMPFAQPMKFLDVAMADPTNLGVIDELRIRTQLNIRSYLAGPKMIERAIVRHYGGSAALPMPSTTERVGPSRSRTPSQVPDSISIGDVDLTAPPPPLDNELMQRPVRKPPRDGLVELDVRNIDLRNKEIDVLQERISKLEALVARDEDVLRKLLSLLIEKGLATREEIVDRLG